MSKNENPQEVSALEFVNLYTDSTRLSPEIKEQVLRDLPSLEEQERLYLEIQVKGGLSIEQLLPPTP